MASQPQRPFLAKVKSIELTINPQGGGEPSWAARQVAQALDAAVQLHDANTRQRLKRPDEDTGADPRQLRRDIQHVDCRSEVDISAPSLEEQRTIASGRSAKGVTCGVPDDIGFGLDNTPADDAFGQCAHQ